MTDGDGPLHGKTGLITGATSGIGEVTARELARRGATVVVVGRSPERIEATLGRIRAAVPGARLDSLRADLSVMADVRRLADDFRARHARLDILVDNAGGIFPRREVTPDGFERTFALNHLAYFLLTDLLLDLLKRSAPSRVVVVASDAHRAVPGFDWDDPMAEGRYRSFRAYCQSKLANILFARELARRLEGTGVTANALHPGFVATNIFNGGGMLGTLFNLAARLVAIPPERGAETSIYLAASPEVEGVTGAYFQKSRPAEPSKAARDDEAAVRLWNLSARLVAEAGRRDPRTA